MQSSRTSTCETTAAASRPVKVRVVPTVSRFLYAHRVPPGSGIIPTNTRIGDKTLDIHGGSYHIPDDEYPVFLDMYRNEVVTGKSKEYLTEKQLESGGPMLVDLDLRFDYSVAERLYTHQHIQDMLCLYLDELKGMYEFDADTKFNVIIFEKPTVNRVADKKITKDGIHIIVGLQVEHAAQMIIRERMISKLQTAWSDLPITNTWIDVLDEGISRGHTNWQLYGSGKPGYDIYRITSAYVCTYSDEYDEITPTEIPNARAHFESAAHFPEISARYAKHPEPFMRPETAAAITERKAPARGSNTSASGGTAPASAPAMFVAESATAISSSDEMAACLAAFLDSLTPAQHELREAYEYTMTLPIEYYGPGSYTKWMRVGWALANIHPNLFIVWCAFSAQAPRFDYMTIRGDLWDRWSKFTFGAPPGEGLTKRSIMHWSKQDAREKFEAVRTASLEYYLDETLEKMSVHSGGIRGGRGCGDFDLATVLYHMYKDSYVCVSIKSSIWYRYRNHRWGECESGTTLRKAVSEDMRKLYLRKIESLREKANAEGADVLDEKSPYGAKIRYILDICDRLGRTKDKQNIMIEAKELFYDGKFLSKMDNNPYLLCFENGVVDFKAGEFREGRPEDCVSLSTKIPYVPLEKADPTIVKDICDFMHKLFPHDGLYEYMWDHLASVLIGTTTNQTFNMYIGIGQNGKSVLVYLMELALGQYKGDVPLTMMTAKERVKVGGVAPEIVQLKGIRYAVMQEPSKGDCINEGIMKQLTGGDPISGRGLYMTQTITFTPQFTIVCCSNEFLGIKSNDHGTWRRIRVVDFESLFTENPVDGDADKPYQFKLDKNIRDRFELWKGVFAAMLVDRAFKTKGNVTDIDKVLASSNSYRASQDYFAEFINDKIAVDPAGFIQKTVLVSIFKEWYNTNYGNRSANFKEVAGYMDKKFGKNKNNIWHGVRIQDTRAIEDECLAHAEGVLPDGDDEIVLEEI